jgi:hypothetical protein
MDPSQTDGSRQTTGEDSFLVTSLRQPQIPARSEDGSADQARMVPALNCRASHARKTDPKYQNSKPRRKPKPSSFLSSSLFAPTKVPSGAVVVPQERHSLTPSAQRPIIMVPRSTQRSQTRVKEEEADISSDDPVDRILRGELPDLESQYSIMYTLKTSELHAIIAEDYALARKCRRAETVLATRPVQPRVSDERQINGNIRLARAVLSLQDKERKWEERLAEHDDRRSLAIENLKAIQSEEVSNLEDFWRSEPRAMTPFSKASPCLLDLRRSQKLHAVTRQFEDAAGLRREAEERQLLEERMAEERAATSMRIAWEQLLAKHQRQLEVLNQNADHDRADIELARDKDLADTELLIRNVETEFNNPYVARARVHSLHRDVISSRETPSMPLSPRTRGQFADYKIAANETRLRLNNANVADNLHRIRVPVHFIQGSGRRSTE